MNDAAPEMQRLFDRQRAATRAEPQVPASERIGRLDRAIGLLLAHQQALCQAAAEDFGQRPAAITRSADILPAVLALRHARRHLRRWMRPRRQRVGWPLGLPGTRAWIAYQPLGVVGIISPWNFPITLTFGPLAGVLAAGNRCLIKPSEITPALSATMQRLVSAAFDASELALVTGGPELGEAFCRLPFDHLLFTGSTAIGRRVMGAAAAQLVPVTLELGGKCPAIIGRSADLGRAVDRILLGKLVNAGQMCLAPDHVYLPAGHVGAFVREARRWVGTAYPRVGTNPDYTNLINDRHAERCAGLLADARARGATLVPLAEELPGDRQRGSLQVQEPGHTQHAPRRLIPTLILGATDDMRVMREEIFAPLLPLRGYERIEDIWQRLAAGPTPLALYYFGDDAAEQRALLARTRSGGVTLNDVALHFVVDNLPFGGLGASGMGAYHGEHGFRRFSHARAVFRQTDLDVAGWLGLRPPYGARLQRRLRWLLRP